MFKEIPIQWQLPVFIVLFIVILFAIGVEINGPLLQIGRHKQVFRQELEMKKNRIKELEKQLDDVKREDVQTIQNGVHPQIVQGKTPLTFNLTRAISKLLSFCSTEVIQ